MKKLTATLLATAVATVAMPAFADTGMYAGLKGGKYLVKNKFVKGDSDSPSFIDDPNSSYASAVVGYQVNNNIGIELEYGSSGSVHHNVAGRKTVTETDPMPTGIPNQTIVYKTERDLSDRTANEKIEHLGAYIVGRYDMDVSAVPMYVKARAGVAQVKYQNKSTYAEKRTVTPTTITTVTDPTVSKTTETGTPQVLEGSFRAKRNHDKVSASGGVALGIKPIKKLDKLSVELEYNYLNKDVQSVGFGTQYQF